MGVVSGGRAGLAPVRGRRRGRSGGRSGLRLGLGLGLELELGLGLGLGSRFGSGLGLGAPEIWREIWRENAWPPARHGRRGRGGIQPSRPRRSWRSACPHHRWLNTSPRSAGPARAKGGNQRTTAGRPRSRSDLHLP